MDLITTLKGSYKLPGEDSSLELSELELSELELELDDEDDDSFLDFFLPEMTHNILKG
jgi:hypothetical protein